MNNAGAPHYYDELTSEPESPVTTTAVRDFSTIKAEGDVEPGTVDDHTATSSQQPSGLTRAFQSLRWKKAAKEEGEPEKAEPARKPPEYTEEARKLVRSFTRVNFQSDTKENR
jgi:hypothetical protein